MITKNCINCNRKFSVFKYRVKTAKYCSKKCMMKGIYKNCIICNGMFRITPSENRIKCCSWKCCKIFKKQYKVTEITKLKISRALKGKMPKNLKYMQQIAALKQTGLKGEKAKHWLGGKPRCIDCDIIISYGASRCNVHSNKLKSGNIHYNWKGENVGYRGLHEWIYNHLGQPDACEFCEQTGLSGHKIHWANKSGQYERNLSDWLRLCVSCHKRYDLARIAGQAVMPA